MLFSHPPKALNTDTTHPHSVLRETYESVSVPSAALRNTDFFTDESWIWDWKRDKNKANSIDKEKKNADDSKNGRKS